MPSSIDSDNCVKSKAKTKSKVKIVPKRKVKKSDNSVSDSVYGKTNMKAISLFSGMGGDSLGMKNAGIDVIAYNEFDKTAVLSHAANFPDCKLITALDGKTNDIMKIEDSVFAQYNGVVDIIFAGFPCQGFSHGGKKLPEDPRNTLFREFVRVTNNVRPRFIIGENVDGLLSRKTADGRNFIDVIEEAFNEIGYKLKWKVCHAVKHGVPQLRKRLIIVGVRDDLKYKDGDNLVDLFDLFDFPVELNDGKNAAGSFTLPDLINIIKYDLTGCASVSKELFDTWNIPDECIVKNMDDDTLPSDAPAGGGDGIVDKRVHPYIRMKLDTPPDSVSNAGKTFHSLVSFAKRESPFHVEVVDIRAPCKTIICSYDHQPRLLLPVQNKSGYYIRTLLPYELKQVQGFPADFIVCGNVKQQIKQIGNAVPPPLITEIVKQLVKINC